MHKFNMNFAFHFYILGFEPAFQLKGWKLIALQNETHMRTSILNPGLGAGWGVGGPIFSCWSGGTSGSFVPGGSSNGKPSKSPHASKRHLGKGMAPVTFGELWDKIGSRACGAMDDNPHPKETSTTSIIPIPFGSIYHARTPVQWYNHATINIV